MKKFLFFTRTDGDSEMCFCDILLFDGSKLGLDRNPPDFSDAVEVSLGKIPTDEDVIRVFKAIKMPDYNGEIDIVPMILDYGEFYPRIYRPFMRNAGRFQPIEPLAMIEVFESKFDPTDPYSFPPIPIDSNWYLKSLSQLALFSERLMIIFRTIEPESRNLDAYGHEIRNLFIIACTEVEAQLKGILVANGYEKEKFNTTDYVKLYAPLKFEEYEIQLPLYPGIPPLRPFSGWNAAEPTKSLVWYDAYNATKHDRENNFSKANINNVINAIAGCAILLISQFGKGEYWKNELREFFRISKVPQWKKEEMYMMNSNVHAYTQVKYKF